MNRRTWREWAVLAVAFVFAGFAVAFVGSFVHLPTPVIWLLVALALATLAYPIFRAPSPAARVEGTPRNGEDRHE